MKYLTQYPPGAGWLLFKGGGLTLGVLGAQGSHPQLLEPQPGHLGVGRSPGLMPPSLLADTGPDF